MAKKPVLTAAEAAKMIPDGATIMCGGFLACGQARAIVKELVKLGTKDLTLIANDMGRAVGPKGEEFFGIAELIHNHQVKRIIATHVGMTPEVGQQNTEGTLEVNLLPQGTLAECIRAGGAGLGGVLTPVGVDTLIEESPFCMGKETIDAFNTSDTRGNSPSYGTTFQKMGHELLSRDELAVLDGGKCILQLRGVRPFLSDKYDLTQHPNYKLTSDYDPKNTFDIEKYLSTNLILKPEDEVELYQM